VAADHRHFIQNFQEDHTNSRRFPGFPGGFLNSSWFPVTEHNTFCVMFSGGSLL